MKNQNNESGRSMIEMLGVLAIIGVLSVGGIAGYSKAMMQYKINKTADQITQIVGNIRTLFANQRNYANFGYSCGYDQLVSIIKKAHLAPEEMWGDESNPHDFLEHPFGGYLTINCADKKSANDYKAFGFDLRGLPEEACMALATYDWGSGSSSGLISVAVNASSVYGSSDGYSIGCTGSSADGQAVACPNGPTVSVPMPVNVAASACHEGDDNAISLKFY